MTGVQEPESDEAHNAEEGGNHLQVSFHRREEEKSGSGPCLEEYPSAEGGEEVAKFAKFVWKDITIALADEHPPSKVLETQDKALTKIKHSPDIQVSIGRKGAHELVELKESLGHFAHPSSN